MFKKKKTLTIPPTPPNLTSHPLQIIAMTGFIKNTKWITPVINKHFATSKFSFTYMIGIFNHTALSEHDLIALLPESYSSRKVAIAAALGWSCHPSLFVPRLWQWPVTGEQGNHIDNKGRVDAWSFNISSKFFLKSHNLCFIILFSLTFSFL